jgi:cell division protein FtsX
MRNALAGIERSLFLTLVFAAFAAALAGLMARAVDRIADAYEASRRDYAVVRVLAPEGPEGLALAEAALNNSPYVISAAPMSASRAAALLGQWAGQSVEAEDLPPLRLVEIELAPTTMGMDIHAELVALMAQGGVTGEVIGASEETAGAGVSHRASVAAGWGAAAFALIMALIVALGARTLAARKRELITVMTDLGATRGRATGQVGDEAALIGLYAGALGAVLAAIAATALMLFAIPGLGLGAMSELILPIDYAPLIAAPLGCALAAGFGARTAASNFFAQASRLA